jgi:flagellin
MFSVNINVGALVALSSLDATQSALNGTQNEVATGQKVSSASDNPAVYAISQAMNARISGLSAVSDNLNFAQSVVGVAQAAATDISSQLASLQNTITQGQQAGIDSTTIDAQIANILSNVDSIANSATFNGVNIAGGTGTDAMTGAAIATNMNVTEDIAGNTFAVAQQSMTSAALGLSGLTVASGGLNFSLDDTAVNAGFAGNTVTITDNGGGTAASPQTTYVFEFNDGTTALQTAPSATFDASGNVLTQTKVFDVQVDPAVMSVNQMTGALISAMQGAGFGVTQQSDGSLGITGNNLNNTAGMATTVTGGSLSAINGTTAAIATVEGAIRSLNGKISTLGSASQQISGLQSFSSSLSTSLTTGLGALTDADMAAESAKLQSLQTKEQLGIQALSIANQQPQSLLTLFR